jgi:hypothetical protein
LLKSSFGDYIENVFLSIKIANLCFVNLWSFIIR